MNLFLSRWLSKYLLNVLLQGKPLGGLEKTGKPVGGWILSHINWQKGVFGRGKTSHQSLCYRILNYYLGSACLAFGILVSTAAAFDCPLVWVRPRLQQKASLQHRDSLVHGQGWSLSVPQMVCRPVIYQDWQCEPLFVASSWLRIDFSLCISVSFPIKSNIYFVSQYFHTLLIIWLQKYFCIDNIRQKDCINAKHCCYKMCHLEVVISRMTVVKFQYLSKPLIFNLCFLFIYTNVPSYCMNNQRRRVVLAACESVTHHSLVCLCVCLCVRARLWGVGPLCAQTSGSSYILIFPEQAGWHDYMLLRAKPEVTESGWF